VTDVDSLNIPEDLKYTKTSEWVKVEGDVIVTGLTDFSQSELTDIVFVELPEVGKQVEANTEYGNVESVKAVADIFSPVNGEVVEVNEALQDTPELINSDCYGEGWYAKIKVSDPAQLDQLLASGPYREFLKTEDAHH